MSDKSRLIHPYNVEALTLCSLRVFEAVEPGCAAFLPVDYHVALVEFGDQRAGVYVTTEEVAEYGDDVSLDHAEGRGEGDGLYARVGTTEID